MCGGVCLDVDFSPKDSKTTTLIDFLEINWFGWQLNTGERQTPTKIPSHIPLFFEKMILFCVYVSLTRTEGFFFVVIFYCTMSSCPTLVASLFKREQWTAVARKDTSDCDCKQICDMLGLKRTIGAAAASQTDQMKRGDWKSTLMIIMELHKKVQILCGNIAEDDRN